MQIQLSRFCGLSVKSVCLSSTLVLAATLPALAGPDFGNNNMRFGGLDLNAKMSIIRDNKPNIPIQIPTINPDVSTAIPNPSISIESIAPRMVIRADGPRMPIIPVIPVLPDLVRNPVVMPITPMVLMPNFSSKEVSIRPISVAQPISTVQGAQTTLSVEVSSTVQTGQDRESRGSGSRSVQLAAFTPQAANQTSSAASVGQTNAGAASGNIDLAEIQAQTFVGRGFGNFVTYSDAINDPVDAEGIKKAVSDRITLFDGTTLFVPDHDMVVETRHGQVQLAAKSVVLVSVSENGLAVYDIHDDKKGSIYVQSGEKTYKLAPGRHVVITTDASGDFAMANALELIAHSDVRHVASETNTHAYTSAFSIPGAINSVSALKSLAVSKDPDMKKVSDKVMKTAAILLTMGNPNYKHYLRPRVTLLSQN